MAYAPPELASVGCETETETKTKTETETETETSQEVAIWTSMQRAVVRTSSRHQSFAAQVGIRPRWRSPEYSPRLRFLGFV